MFPRVKAGRLARFGFAATLCCAAALTSACAREVAMQPAPDANNPACAEVIVRLPELVADQPQRHTNAQATSAWGIPASVLLRCGVGVEGPTDLPCMRLDGVDWVRDDSAAPLFRFSAYGREPGVEVVIDAEATPPISGTTALIDLSGAVSVLPQTRECASVVEGPAR